MSETYVVVDRDGEIASGFMDSAEEAWRRERLFASEAHNYGPYTVARLVPVPRPVPPRPTMDYLGKTLHVANDLLHFAPDTVYHVCEISTMRKVIALAEQTDAWEREFGGAS